MALEGGGSGIIPPKKKAVSSSSSKKSSGSIGRAVGSAVKAVAKPSASRRRYTGSSGRSSGGSGASYSRSRNNSGGGGGGGYSSGGGGGGGGGTGRSGGSGGVGAPSLKDYLAGDGTYQTFASGNKRSLNDFLSEMGRRRGEAGTQFNQTRQSMERDRTTQLDALRDEFASRGLIQSGLYGEEQGNFQKKFTEQMTALQQQQAGLLSDLLGQETNYKRENQLALEQARQDALLRRSQKYA